MKSYGLNDIFSNSDFNINTSRYGYHTINFINRNNEICFTNLKTKKQFSIAAKTIALSKKTIEQFDSIQAFYIGLLAI